MQDQMSPNDYFGTSIEQSNKLDSLASKKQEKVDRLSGKVARDGYVYSAENKVFNEFSDAEAMGMLGSMYAEEGLYQDSEGRVRRVKDDSEYTGNTNWLYGYKTKDPELDAYKIGFSREDRPEFRYSEDRHPDWEFGSQGADTSRVDGRMELLFPEEVTVPMEAMLHGRETALDNRWFRQREDGSYEAPQGYLDFGSGATEVYTSPEGVFGDSRDDVQRSPEELREMFHQVQRQVYDGGLSDEEFLEQRTAQYREERKARERAESPVWTEAKQTLAGTLAGIGKGAIELADAAQELGTWVPQTAVRVLTGDDSYDIDWISNELKEQGISAIDETVGYDREYYDQVMQGMIDDLNKAGVDITSWEAMKSAVTDPDKRQYLSDATLKAIASPAMLASMVAEIVGAGGVLGAGTKLGAKVASRVAPELSSKVSPLLESNIDRIRREVAIAKEAGDKARVRELEKSYTLAKRIPDLMKGTVYTNADMAVRVNNDIDEYTANNEGEGPDAAKILQIVALDRLASSAEIGALKVATRVGGLTEQAISTGLKDASSRIAKELGKSVTVEAAQETMDGIVEQINQKLGSKEYEGKSLGDILEETSAEILTGTIAGAATGGYVSAGSELVDQVVGVPGAIAKVVESRATGDREPTIVEPEQVRPEKVDPTDTSYKQSFKYNYNKASAEEAAGTREAAQGIVFGGQSSVVLDEEGRTTDQKLQDILELVEIAGEEKQGTPEQIERLVDSIAGKLEMSTEEVQRLVLGAQERGAMVGRVAAKDQEAVGLLKEAENAYAARDRDAIDRVETALVRKVEELGDEEFSELVNEVVGDRLAKAEAEARQANKEVVDRVDQLRDEVRDVGREFKARKTKELVDTLEDSKYVLGSSKKAMETIGVLYEASGTSSSRVNQAIDRIAEANNVSPEQVKLIKKTFDTVRKEASTGSRGYVAYGNALDELMSDPEQNAVAISQLEDTARYFYDSQVRAAEALREGISRAEEAIRNPVEPNQPIVTEYKKADGDMFDIRVKDDGRPVAKDIEMARKVLAEKEANIKGLEDNVFSKLGMPQEQPRRVPKVEKAERAKPIWGPESAENVKQAIREGADKDILVDRLVRANKLTRASAEKVYAKAKAEVDKETVKAKPKAEKKEEQPKEVVEQVEKKLEGKLGREVIKGNIGKGKIPTQFNAEGKAMYSDKQKGVMGTVERNLAKVVKVSRPTVLNSVEVGTDKKLDRMAKAGIESLGRVIKPLQSNEVSGEKGGYESFSSPSRALIFQENGEMNGNVVAALYAAAIEGLNTDGYMVSPYTKTTEDVADMMGMQPEEVTPELYNLVKGKGMLLDTLVNSLGDNVVSLLGLSPAKEDGVDLQNYARLKTDLGNAALHVAIGRGLVTVDNSVTANQLSKALGNEAINNNARVNFVQFTEEGLNSREWLGKVNKQVKAAIPEVEELRPRPKMEEFSRAEINRYKNNVRRDIAEQVPTELTKKAIEKAMKTEWELDVRLAEEVVANKDKVMRQAGYIAEDSEEFARLSYEDKDSQRGVNNKVLRDMEALEDLLEGNRNKKGVSMWFAHYTGRNGRLYMESSTVNPMNEKNYHRWVIQPKSMEASYEVSKVDGVFKFESEGKNVSELVQYAIAQGLGYAVDKKDSKKIAEFANAVLGMGKSELQAMKRSLLDGKVYKVPGTEFEAESEHVGHVLQVMQFVEDVARGKTKIDSKLSAEFDAVTSGFGLKLMQLPVIGNLYEYLAKVGVVVPSKLNKETAVGRNSDATSMNDFLDREGVLDNYQTLAKDVDTPTSLSGVVGNAELVSSNEGKRVASQLRGLEELWTDMRKVLPQKVNGEVSSSLRNLFKYPFMTFNYARSVNNIKKGLATDITRELLGRISKEDLRDPANAELRKVALDLARLTGVRDLPQALRDMNPRQIEVRGKGSLQDVLETMVLHSYGAEVEKAFKREFGEFEQAQEVITDSFKLVYTVFEKMYNKKVEEQRILNKGRVLTQEQHSKIVKELLEVFPVIEGPASEKFANNPLEKATFDDGIAIVRQKKVGQESKWYLPTQFQTVNNELTGSVSRKASTRMKTFEIPGVAGVVIPIHYTDAAILMNTLVESDSEMMTIHDAVIPRLVDADSVVKKYNENTVKVNRGYSFVEAVANMVNRVDAIVKELDADTRKEVESTQLNWRPSYIDPKTWEALEDKSVGAVWQSGVERIAELSVEAGNRRSEVFNALDSGEAKVMHMAGLSNMVYNTEMDVDNLVVERLDREQTDEVFEKLFGNKVTDMLNCIGKGE